MVNTVAVNPKPGESESFWASSGSGSYFPVEFLSRTSGRRRGRGGRAEGDRSASYTTITEILAGVYEPEAEGRRPPESLYGYLKMWAHLRRQGIPVAPLHRGTDHAHQRLARGHPRQAQGVQHRRGSGRPSGHPTRWVAGSASRLQTGCSLLTLSTCR